MVLINPVGMTVHAALFIFRSLGLSKTRTPVGIAVFTAKHLANPAIHFLPCQIAFPRPRYFAKGLAVLTGRIPALHQSLAAAVP
jgi:hypothetical protein